MLKGFIPPSHVAIFGKSNAMPSSVHPLKGSAVHAIAPVQAAWDAKERSIEPSTGQTVEVLSNDL